MGSSLDGSCFIKEREKMREVGEREERERGRERVFVVVVGLSNFMILKEMGWVNAYQPNGL